MGPLDPDSDLVDPDSDLVYLYFWIRLTNE